jgi:4-alpha-glucanotransferase
MAGAAVGSHGYGNSPYQSLSSFAGNELLISPDGLIEDGLLRASDCRGSFFSASAIDYNAVIAFKRRLLKTAWINFSAGARTDLRPSFDQFCHEEAHWLALFRALKARYNGAYYLGWLAELVRRVPAASAQTRYDLAGQIEQVCLGQFLLFRQARRLKKHARAKVCA